MDEKLIIFAAAADYRTKPGTEIVSLDNAKTGEVEVELLGNHIYSVKKPIQL